MRRACSIFGLLALMVAGASLPVRAQTSLGGQRIGTSSGTFLKILLDARAAGIGGAANSVVQGPGAVFVNPAAILVHRGGTGLYLSYIQWPADLQVGAFCISRSITAIDAQIAAAVSYLSTSFDETTEYYPQGTGRSVTYSDIVAALAFSRYFTDRLAIGASAKLFREDLGSNLGGPTLNQVLFDAGSVFSLGFRNSRISVTLLNFGSDLRPKGSYTSHVTNSEVRYTAFSPPTQFLLGFAIDPILREKNRLTSAVQVQHQADKQESMRAGLEYWYDDSYALRTGYDFSSDEMGLSAGVGLKLRLATRTTTLDYAYTAGGHLSSVHRLSMSFGMGKD